MTKVKTYLVEWGVNQSGGGTFQSTSRDSKRHGQELLGTADGGWVRVYSLPLGKILSQALYTPENGGR